MASSEAIYTGFWINRSGNAITGATLTMQNGSYFVAFLAMVVRTAGRHFWQLICYTVFHCLPKDGFLLDTSSRQQRAVLRNTSSAPDGMVNFMQISKRSRRTGEKRNRVPLSLAIAAALNVVAFVAAAIFSSAVTSTQNDVLLRGSSVCGPWAVVDLASAKDWNQTAFIRSLSINSVVRENMVAAAQKSVSCGNGSTMSPACDGYNLRPIAFGTNDIPCPFGSTVCLDDALGVELDTGFFDSYEALGINSGENERITFRKKVQCAPIRTDGFSRPLNDTEDEAPFQGFFYGPNIPLKSNWTFAFNPKSMEISNGSAPEVHSYQIAIEATAFDANAKDSILSGSSFEPIPALRKTNGIVTLAFLSKQAKYLQPVKDPWFRATNFARANFTSSDNYVAEMEIYLSANPVSVIACAEETLLSNSSSGENTVALSLVKHINPTSESLDLRLNKRQASIIRRAYDYLAYTALPQAAYSLTGNGLLASSYVQYNMSPGLPRNQWQLEVQNWFSTSLNALQMFSVQYVTGYGRKDFDKFASTPPSSDQWMCEQQIVRGKDYASFSVLGIAIILILSGLIVALNVSLRSWKRIHSQKSGRSEWESYCILNLYPATNEGSIQLPSLYVPATNSDNGHAAGEKMDWSPQTDSTASPVIYSRYQFKDSNLTTGDERGPVIKESQDRVDERQ